MSNQAADLNNGNTYTEEERMALKTISGAFRKGVTIHESTEYYDRWAENGMYDLNNAGKYKGPENVAMRLRDHFPEGERSKVRVLDVGAGTGLVGIELYHQGFRTMDALEPSPGMVKLAKERGVYSKYIEEYIGAPNSVPVEDGYYDAITGSGIFGAGHIPASAMSEMIRVVRPGGLICLTTHENRFTEYRDMMAQLEAEGKWKLKSREMVENHIFDSPGVVYQFIVL